MEVKLFDTGVLKQEETTNEPALSTFVPPNLESRLVSVPAVTYRPQSSGEPGQRTDVLDRLGEAPVRRTNHPRRRLGLDNGDIRHLEIVNEIGNYEQAEKNDNQTEKVHTFPLACLQTGPDENEPSDKKVCSRCHKDVEWIEAIRQRTVLNRRCGLVDSNLN